MMAFIDYQKQVPNALLEQKINLMPQYFWIFMLIIVAKIMTWLKRLLEL